MDQKDALNIANKYAKAVKEKYDYKRIILFGSYVSGGYHDESDIDIAVVLKDYKNLLDIQLELMRLRRKIDSRIEPHPFREKDFDVSNPFAHEIIRTGKEVAVKS